MDTATQPSYWTMVGRQYDYWRTVYLRTWKASVVSSFVAPIFFVLAMGVLLGGFVEADAAELEGAPTYLAYIAPGLLAAVAVEEVPVVVVDVAGRRHRHRL